MPRYHFHLHNDIDVPDPEGMDLPNIEAAVLEASRQARALIAANVVEKGEIILIHRIDIEDEEGNLLETLNFGDVLTIRT